MGGDENSNATESKVNWNSKYDAGLEASILNWIADVLERPDEFKNVSGHSAFREKFKDGVILCELLNKLLPGSIKKYHKSPKLAFQQMENIGFANEAMHEYGVQSEYIFVTNDLYQGKNLYQVQLGLRNLGDKANDKGFTPNFKL